MTQTLLPRNEVAKETTWDAQSVFASDEAWEAEFQRVSESLPGFRRFQGTLGESPARLLEWFAAQETLRNNVGRLFTYAMMFSVVDALDQTAAARQGRMMGLYSRAAAATAFAEPEMLEIAPETLRRWMQEEPHLALYAHWFEQLETRRPHVRSAEVEELFGLIADSFATTARIHSTLSDAELAFPPALDSAGQEQEIAQGTISALLTDPDRETRRTAWEHYADAYLAHKNTMANCLAAGIKQDVFFMRAQRYDSSLEASLSQGHVPVSVFHNLITTFRKRLPVWHRYWEIRRKALGYETFHVYDCKAPLTQSMPKVSYEQAIEWISEGMQPLGDEYVQAMRRGLLQERWVDVYPNKGKRMGAFSSGVQGTHPFIFMSYNDDLFSLSTLAHELGHSLHSYHSWQAQPPVYANYGLFVAEVASNFNQALVRAHLLKTNPDPNFQIAVIEEAMANFHRYFFVMPTLARFELEIHERVERGAALTADSLMTLMTDLFREGFGDGVEVDAERVGITWAQFPTHLYSNFYVYQYATGISGANALAEAVLTGGAEARDRYLAFLKAGSSLYPMDALRLAGVDLESPEPVERAFGVFARMVERLAELLGQ